MAIVSEDGTGVAAAEMYGDIPAIDLYWSKRPQIALAATWAAAAIEMKEGAAREATAHLDAFYGPHYVGQRKGYAQGLEWPRIAGYDDAGAEIALTDKSGIVLPALPPQLLAAVAELSARALIERLAVDGAPTARVKALRKKVGPLEKETEFFDSGPMVAWKSFGDVAGILAALLDGSQPGGNSANWHWR